MREGTIRSGAGFAGFARDRLVWALLLVGSFLQQPGRTTWDTKYDLTADPGAFLGRSLHLWNPDASFGELQNQAYGYLFPQGPFFLLGDVLGVSDWVVQRLWSAVLLIAAYEGVRLLARALGLPALAAVLAGLVYTLSPRMVGSVGVLSGEVLPPAALPWALLPLVLARTGRLSARQAGLWSAVAVLFMSGVNAVGTLATVPIMVAVIVEQVRRPHGRALLAWWTAGMVVACAWWIVPLLLLGQYSPPFLDFIETASATTSTTGWANSVRGSEHWLAYFSLGGRAWWPGAYEITTRTLPIVAGGLVAALGLFGLCHRTMPLRRALLPAAILGLLCLTAGSAASWGSLVDGSVRELLDGALAPFRNVHKIDPIIRLPLALGAGHATVLLLRRLDGQRELRRTLVVAMVTVVVVGALPLVNGGLRMPGFREAPAAWDEAAAYLADKPHSRALVLPGSGFGLQSWGWTIDEPLQGAASSGWVSRSQVPLVPGPTARYLDTIERRVAAGEGSAGLTAMLARGGITHVVLRRDLNPLVTETVPSERAELALVRSPGLERVRGFGSSGFGDQTLIDVYEVRDPTPPVTLLEASAMPRLRGAPDDVLTALEANLLEPDQPVVITTADGAAPAIVGDAYPRVERQFGRVHDATSDVLSADAPPTTQRSAADFPGVPGMPMTTAELDSGAVVSASTSQGFPDEFGAVRPEFAPYAALDGNFATEWRSGTLQPPDEQWLQLDLDTPVRGGVLSVQFVNGEQIARVSRVRVRLRTASGESSVVYGIPDSGLLLASLPEKAVDRVRLEVVEAVGENAPYGLVVVSEVIVPNLDPGRSRVVPGALAAADAMVLRVNPPRRPCVDLGLGPQCHEVDARPGQDTGRLDRTIEVGESGEWELSGQVIGTPGPGSSALLAPLGKRATVRSRSVLGGDPAVSAGFAFDDNPGTSWLTRSEYGRARLRLTWPGAPRVVSGFSIKRAPATAVAPGVAILESGGVRRVVDLDWSSEVEPFVARGRLRVTFERPEGFGTTDLPMGVAEMQIEGLEGLASSPDWSSRTGAPCGLGPQVSIDGELHDTEVSGTLDDVRLGTPLAWTVCDGPVSLDAGSHRVVVQPTLQFQPVLLGLRPSTASSVAADPVSARAFDVDTWEATHREVSVGPGHEAVLRVAENVNSGWVATLGGDELEKVSIDGWQQGYVVPAGAGGTVTLEFRPDATYRFGLLGGLLLALGLVLAAVVGQVAERRRPRVAPAASTAVRSRADPERSREWPARAVAGGGLLMLGGPVAAAAFLVGAVRRGRRVTAWAGAALVLVSAVLSVVAEDVSVGRPGTAANLAAGAGVGLLVASVLFPATPRVAPHPTFRAAAIAVRAWLRRHRVLIVGLGLVAAQAVVRFVLADGSYWWQDDFLHLDVAQTMGLGSEYLLRDHGGHVEVGPFFVFWLLSQVASLSYTPAVLILVGMQLTASCLFWVLLRQLFGRGPWLLVPLAAYLFTPLGIATGTWLAAGLEAIPLQIAMFASLIGLVRLHRTGHVRWAVVSVLAHGFGLLCWEKAVVVSLVLLAVELLVLSAGIPIRERLGRLRRRWWFWAAHGSLLVGYAVLYVSVTASGSMGAELDRGIAPSLQDMILKVLLPGLFGGPWSADGAGNTIYTDTAIALQVIFALLAIAVVALSLRLRGRAALAGWLLVVGYVVGDVALVLLGRGSYLSLVSRDPRYFTDAVPIVLLGVCAAFTAPRSARSRPASLPWPPALGRIAAPILATALVVSALVTTVVVAPVTQHERSEEYVRTVTGNLRADPGAAVLFSAVPPDVGVQVNLESLLRAMGREQRIDRPGTNPLVVDGFGSLRPAQLVDVDVDRNGPAAECGWAVSNEPSRLVALPPRSGEHLVLRLEYVAGVSGVLHVRVDGVEQAVAYDAGIGAVSLAVTGLEGSVEAWTSSDSSGLCVAEVARGVASTGD